MTWDPHSENAKERRLGPDQIAELLEIGPRAFVTRHGYNPKAISVITATYRRAAALERSKPGATGARGPVSPSGKATPRRAEVPPCTPDEDFHRAQVMIAGACRMMATAFGVLAGAFKTLAENLEASWPKRD